MAEKRQNVLVVEVDSERFDKIAPLLQRKHFDVDRFPGARGALELVTVVPFRALIVGYPLRDVPFETFFRAVRGEGSASRQAPIALLARTTHFEEANAYLQRRIQLVISDQEEPAQVEQKLSTFLGILSRTEVRILVKLNVTMTDNRQERFMAQTKDISASGMFVSTNRKYPKGSKAVFEFVLESDSKPFSGLAEVVRCSEQGDRIQGMGLRFMQFRKNTQDNLKRALDVLKG